MNLEQLNPAEIDNIIKELIEIENQDPTYGLY